MGPGARLVTADLPPDVFHWADSLRRAHFPAERNKLKAHVTLFHALPPSIDAELQQLLGELARGSPPEARVTGLMKMANGTALAVDSPGMVELHQQIRERMHGLLAERDTHRLRLHITIQNKVSPREARALQRDLAPVLPDRRFRFRGFEVFVFEEGIWRPVRQFPFRG